MHGHDSILGEKGHGQKYRFLKNMTMVYFAQNATVAMHSGMPEPKAAECPS